MLSWMQMKAKWLTPKWTAEEFAQKKKNGADAKWSGTTRMDPHYLRYGEVEFAKAPDIGEQRMALARWNRLARNFEKSLETDLDAELACNDAYAALDPTFDFDSAEYKRLRAGAVLVACLTPVRLDLCVV